MNSAEILADLEALSGRMAEEDLSLEELVKLCERRQELVQALARCRNVAAAGADRILRIQELGGHAEARVRQLRSDLIGQAAELERDSQFARSLSAAVDDERKGFTTRF